MVEIRRTYDVLVHNNLLGPISLTPGYTQVTQHGYRIHGGTQVTQPLQNVHKLINNS